MILYFLNSRQLAIKLKKVLKIELKNSKQTYKRFKTKKALKINSKLFINQYHNSFYSFKTLFSFSHI